MKYYKKKIIEDATIFRGLGIHQVARITGFDPAYISRVNSGKVVVTEQQYLNFLAHITKYKELLDKVGQQVYN